MSDYTKATNFAVKDGYTTGNPSKVVKGTELDDEFNAIANAVSSKADIASPTFTGTPAAPTAASGTNTTQLATTAFVTGAITTLDSEKVDTTVTINAGSGLTGGGNLSANRTLSHADTSSQASVNNSGNTFIQDITLDDYGHITALVSNTVSNPSGVGTVTNGGTFSITTGASGVALVLVPFYTRAEYGNFGSSTGSISIGGSSVASQDTRTMEYDGRLSGANPVIVYKYSGSANATVTVTFNWSGSGSFQDAKYIYLGL